MPVLKRSEDKIKLINPGFQVTYRIMTDAEDGNKHFKADVTCLRGDSLASRIEAGETFTVCDEYDRYKSKTFEAGKYTAKALQVQVMKDGRDCRQAFTLAEKSAYYKDNLSHFGKSETRLINPHFYKVDISDDLYNLKISIINRLVEEINGFADSQNK